MTTFAQHVRIRARVGRRDDLARKFADTVAFLEGNDDCILTLVSLDPDDDHVVCLTEAWTSAEAHAATVASDAVQQWAVGMDELVDGPPQVQKLEPTAWLSRALVQR
jgi:quinol monooxygenase YgiN